MSLIFFDGVGSSMIFFIVFLCLGGFYFFGILRQVQTKAGNVDSV